MRARRSPPPAPPPRPAAAPLTRPRSQVPARGKTSRAASPGAGGAAPLPRADSCGLTVAALSPSASSRRVPSGGGAGRAGGVASVRPGRATGLGVARGKTVISVIRQGGAALRRVGSSRSSVRPGRRHRDASTAHGDALLLGAVAAASPAGTPGCRRRLGGREGGPRDARPVTAGSSGVSAAGAAGRRRGIRVAGGQAGRCPAGALPRRTPVPAAPCLLRPEQRAPLPRWDGHAWMDRAGSRTYPGARLPAGWVTVAQPKAVTPGDGTSAPQPYLSPPHREAAPGPRPDTHRGLPVGRDPRGHRAGDRPPAPPSPYATGLPPRLRP